MYVKEEDLEDTIRYVIALLSLSLHNNIMLTDMHHHIRFDQYHI